MKHLATSLKLIAARLQQPPLPSSAHPHGPDVNCDVNSHNGIRLPKPPPTSATPQMISEAIQRSKARCEEPRQPGQPSSGSEEPFTFDPTK